MISAVHGHIELRNPTRIDNIANKSQHNNTHILLAIVCKHCMAPAVWDNLLCSMLVRTLSDECVQYKHEPRQNPGYMARANSQNAMRRVNGNSNIFTTPPRNMYMVRGLVFLYGSVHMMMSSNGNTFHVTGHLCGEFIGHR